MKIILILMVVAVFLFIPCIKTMIKINEPYYPGQNYEGQKLGNGFTVGKVENYEEKFVSMFDFLMMKVKP